MIPISRLKAHVGKRPFLIGILALLVAVKMGNAAINHFNGLQEEVANREDLLDQYRRTTRTLEKLRAGVAMAENRKKQLDVFMFSGGSAEEISSAMQIILQEMVTKSGLEPQSIRPRQSEKNKDADYGEVAISMRLAGSLNNFVKFMADLYNSKQLFLIEGFTLKSYKKNELQIFLELKGYYLLNNPKT